MVYKSLVAVLLLIGLCGCSNIYWVDKEVELFSGDEIRCASYLWNGGSFLELPDIVNAEWRYFSVNVTEEDIKKWFLWAEKRHEIVKAGYIKNLKYSKEIKTMVGKLK